VNYYLNVKWSKENTEIMGMGKNPQNRKHKWTNSFDMDTTAICASRVCQTNAPFGSSFWPWCQGYLLLVNFLSFMPFPIACVYLFSAAHSLYVENIFYLPWHQYNWLLLALLRFQGIHIPILCHMSSNGGLFHAL